MKNINLNFENAIKTVVALAVSALSIACTSCDEKDDIIVPNYKLTLEVDGDIVKDTTVAEGTLVNLSLFDGLADKEMTAEFTYVFAGWEYLGETVKSVVVNEDMTVEAKYDEVVNKYDVTFVIEDELVEYAGTDLVQSIAYNGKVKFPEFECPKHVSYAWYDESGVMVEDLDNVKVSGDATYTAKCGGENTSSVVVKFEGIEREDVEITFACDEEKTYDAKIAKLGDLDVEGYEWVFDNDNNVVKYTIKTFKVTFDFGGIRENVEVEVEYGKSADAPKNVEVEGYTFDGWNGKFENVTSDNVVYAKYTAWTITISDKDGKNVTYTYTGNIVSEKFEYSGTNNNGKAFTYYLTEAVNGTTERSNLFENVEGTMVCLDTKFKSGLKTLYRYPEIDTATQLGYVGTSDATITIMVDNDSRLTPKE